MYVVCFLSLKTVENITKEAIKDDVIDMKIISISNNRTPVIRHPRDHAPVT